MAGKEDETTTFHNEGALLQIARWAKVTAWIIVVIYLLSFIQTISQVISGGGLNQLPSDFLGKLLFLANVLYPLALGTFYFLILNGLAQGLYVALDLFISTEDEEPEGIVP